MKLRSICIPLVWVHNCFSEAFGYLNNCDYRLCFTVPAYILMGCLYISVFYIGIVYYLPSAFIVYIFIAGFQYVWNNVSGHQETATLNFEEMTLGDFDDNDAYVLQQKIDLLERLLELSNNKTSALELYIKQYEIAIGLLKNELDIALQNSASMNGLELCYQMLGVNSNSSTEDIRKAYLDKAKKVHPDHQGDEDIMRALNLAYEMVRKSDHS